jgi:hypothetical protein
MRWKEKRVNGPLRILGFHTTYVRDIDEASKQALFEVNEAPRGGGAIGGAPYSLTGMTFTALLAHGRGYKSMEYKISAATFGGESVPI